jgi:hypothetical protein
MEFSRHVVISIAAYFTYSYKFKNFDEYKNTLKKIISSQDGHSKEACEKNCMLSTNEQLLTSLDQLEYNTREWETHNIIKPINLSFCQVFDTYYESYKDRYNDEEQRVFYISPSLVNDSCGYGFNHSIEYDNIEEDNSLDFTKTPMVLSQNFIDIIEKNDLQHIIDGLKFYSNIGDRSEFD